MKKYYKIGLLVFLLGLWLNLYGAHNITEDAIDTIGPEGIPELIDAAKSLAPEDDIVREKAIKRLGDLKAKEALDVLIEVLDTRRTIAGGKEVYNWKLKMNAARSLAEIGDERALPYLVNMVNKETDMIVKRSGAQALGMMGETARKRSVLEILYYELDRTKDNALASDICEALGKIGDKSSFIYLLRVTQGPYLNYVKETAQKSIAMTKWDKPSVLDQTADTNNASVSQYNK